MRSSEMDHVVGPTHPVPATGPGALPGFEAVCTCGLRMRNSIRCNVDLDAQDHVDWAQRTSTRKGRAQIYC
jgi:hypothetical protein